MTNRKESQLKMFRVVDGVLDTNKSVVDTIPAMKREASNFKGIIVEIDDLVPRQSADGKGVTKFKNIRREDINLTAVGIAGAMFSYGTSTGNADLCQRMNVSEYTVSRLALADFISFCSDLSNELVKAGTAITEYGPSQEMVTSFIADAESFKSISTSPRTFRVEKSTATSELDDLFTQGNSILLNHLDMLILQLKRSQPVFFKNYWNGRIIEDRGTRTTEAKKTAKAKAQPSADATTPKA